MATGMAESLGLPAFMQHHHSHSDVDKKTIHSGHFMVSRVHEDESINDTDQLANPTPDDDAHLTIDSNLNRLFECMTLAYCGKITSPKWKPFKGMKLKLKDKIRLNNIIWREWYLQFRSGQRPVVCQFAIPIHDTTHAKPESCILEGKYWKRRLETVCTEYIRWRAFVKKQLSLHENQKGLNDQELLDRLPTSQRSGTSVAPSITSTLSYLDTSIDDLELMDFSDTLFSTFTQPVLFPDPKELSGSVGNADFLQPSLFNIGPSADEFELMDIGQEFSPATKPAQTQFVPRKVATTNRQQAAFMPFDIAQNHFHSAVRTPPGVPSPVPEDPTPTLTPDTAAIQLQYAPQVAIPQLISPSNQPTMTVQRIAQQQTGQANGQLLLTEQPNVQTVYVPSVSDAQQATTSLSVFVIDKPQPNAAVNVKQYEWPTPTQQEGRQRRSSHPHIQQTSLPSSSRQERSNPGTWPNLTMLLQQPDSASRDSRPVARFRSEPQVSRAKSVTSSHKVTRLFSGYPLSASATSNTVKTEKNSQQKTDSTVTFVLPQSQSKQTRLKFRRQKADPSHRDWKRNNHSLTEQRRRSNINYGIEQLCTLVPSLEQHPKSSKAVILRKACDYLRVLKTEKANLQLQIDKCKAQVNTLNFAIAERHKMMPVAGLSLEKVPSPQRLNEMFEGFVRQSTNLNWKFYLFSRLLRRLFESYCSEVRTGNVDDFIRDVFDWLNRYCSLPELRPAASQALMELSVHTSVLTNPSVLPQECMQAINNSLRT